MKTIKYLFSLILIAGLVFFANKYIAESQFSFVYLFNNNKHIDIDDFISTTKSKLLNRENSFEFEVTNSLYKTLLDKSYNLSHSIIGLAYLEDDKSISTDSDYLERSIKSIDIRRKTYPYSNKTKLIFNIEYVTSYEQELQISSKISEILIKLRIYNHSDYKKAKLIHDFIVEHVKYDESLTNHSSYSALFDKSGVCEAYSTLAYRMFTDAGIECKIITGMAGNDTHAWNILKIDGKWYNIDLTWDDPITHDGSQHTRYDYFLKNEKAFYEHVRDSKYLTDEFLSSYPIAEKSYKAKKK